MKLKNGILLFLTALIWGIAFVAQSVGMDYVQPFTFNAVRSLIGGAVLIPCIFVMDRLKLSDRQEKQENPRILLIGGICCGIALCVASNLQQIGIQYTSVGKAGFITALYIVIVPIFSIFLRRKAGIKVWISVFMAVVGLYLLCMTEQLSLGKGDFLVLLCAVVFAIHILVIDYFSPKVDGVKMSCIQFFVCGILSAVCMFVTEQPQISSILAAWQPVLYAGVLSCGVAYTLQIIGQKGVNPTIASLILSLESVVSVLSGWLILKQQLSSRELMGCLLMFIAIILAQLPDKRSN